MKMRILIADDETEIRASVREILEDDGHEVLEAENTHQALSHADSGLDLAFVDIKLGEENGVDLLQGLRRRLPHLPVVMITGYGNISLATQAFKLGAQDFLEKPLRLVQIRTCIRNALEGIRLRKEIALHRAGPVGLPVYQSQKMKRLFGQAQKLASVREPVILMGPSGSGKDLLARALHFGGGRSQGPWITTNAASMPVNLSEDELFGHEKGAFTGADRRRMGCLEQAHKGTLFLDEIGDMDLAIQAKLLRVLEDGSFRRLGGEKEIRTDVRLVCATHKNLEEMAGSGAFRHDLWYRISTFVLRVPGLDERKEDIPALAEHFLAAVCSDLGSVRQFDPRAMEMLKARSYPGNVRELKQAVTRLAVLGEREVIDPEDVQQVLGSPGREVPRVEGPSDFRAARTHFEKSFLQKALAHAGGNITAAAQAIGMAQSNLSRKLKELGLRK